MSSDQEKARLLLTRFGGDVEKAARRLAAASEPVAAGRRSNLKGFKFEDEFNLPTFKRGQKIAPRYDNFHITVKSLDDPDGDGIKVLVSTEPLGRGEYGHVNHGWLSGQAVAVKFIPFYPPVREDARPLAFYGQDDFKREVELATRAGEKNLGAKIYASGIYKDIQGEEFYILVQEKLNELNESDEEEYETKVLDLVKSLYFDANIYHRDTHSGNVKKTDDGGFRLIDFGKAVDLGEMSENVRQTFKDVVRDVIRIFLNDFFYSFIIEIKEDPLPLIGAKSIGELNESNQAFVDSINAWVMSNESLLVQNSSRQGPIEDQLA
jgi:hypothetical protein